MQTFQKIFGTTYKYTDLKNEIPDSVTKHLEKNYGSDYNNEKIICAAWSSQFGVKGAFYVVVTEARVITRKAKECNQIFLKNVTSTARSPFGDIVLKAAGVNMDLFHAMAMPKRKLLDILYEKINSINLNREKVSPPSSSSVSVADELKKFSDLKEQGIITEEEFQQKKKQLLG